MDNQEKQVNPLRNMTMFLAKALFKKDSPIIPDGAFPANSEPGIVLARIRQLLDEGNINTAENLLFDSFDKKKPYFVAIGLELYARISELTPEELEAADFSREEIQQGIGDMLKFYNIKIAIKRPPAPGQSAPNGQRPTSGQNQNVAPNVLADPPKKL